ncbi:MAG: tetratricopeptide repeat protein [Verrucomicrobia bacterium]|nr:tetratricopeptide repeat protein [Verrucomicrobiota bacterium]
MPKTFRFLSAGIAVLLFLCLSASRALAVQVSGLDADASIRASSVALEKKDYKKALSDLGPALQLRPEDPTVLNLKGAILTKTKDYAGAQLCYEGALKASPGFFPARYNIGALLSLQQEWDPAIAYFRNLLIEQPNNELVEYKLLLLLLIQGSDPALERRLFDSPIPSNTPAWYFALAARSYKAGDSDKASRLIDVAKSVYGDKTQIFQEELDESGLATAKK